MERSIEALSRHVAPGGLLLVEPLWEPDAHREGELKLNIVDKPDLKIAWMYTNDRVGDLAHWENHYLVGTPDGVDAFVEVHEAGLFTDTQYRHAFASAGLAMRRVGPRRAVGARALCRSPHCDDCGGLSTKLVEQFARPSQGVEHQDVDNAQVGHEWPAILVVADVRVRAEI